VDFRLPIVECRLKGEVLNGVDCALFASRRLFGGMDFRLSIFDLASGQRQQSTLGSQIENIQSAMKERQFRVSGIASCAFVFFKVAPALSLPLHFHIAAFF